ncbi:MAG: tetratricopeptide repeat protein [Bacteroidota bacterium]|jgi:Tfp pilus assembly protein PilF|nr:tetratricopeptide repeat protein [Bacteroidota bacterium]
MKQPFFINVLLNEFNLKFALTINIFAIQSKRVSMEIKAIFPKNKILLFIFALTFFVYGNTLKNRYAFDDDYVTVTTPEKPNNPRIEKGIAGIPEIFRTHYVELKDQSFEYRPLVLTTFAIEYQIFKSNPFVSHLINVLIYALSCYLLFLLLLKIFQKNSELFSLLIVAIFIVHPIHTEVVANIKCRDELLGFFFGLLATLLLYRYCDSKKWYFILMAIASLLAGILCKKTAELFIFFAPFSLYFFSKSNWKQALIYCLLLYSAVPLFNFIESSLVTHDTVTRDYVFFENPLFYKGDFLSRLPISLYSLGYYLKLLFLPYPLSCYYGFNVVPDAEWGNPVVILSALIYIGMLIFAIIKFKEKSVLSYCVLVFLLGIYPFSNLFFTPTGIIADRYIYFSSLPFCIALVWGLLKINNIALVRLPQGQKIKLKSFFIYCFLFLLSTYSITSISRNSKWKDELTLLRNDLRHFPQSCNLNYIGGNKLYSQILQTPAFKQKEDLITEAKKYFKQALDLMEQGVNRYPEDFTTLNNIGTIYVNIFNDPVSALPFFKRSLAANSKNKQTLFNYAFCYERKNQKDSAMLAYENLIRIDEDFFEAYARLKPLYLEKNNFTKALVCDQKAIEKDPGNAKLYIDFGNTYINNKDTTNAINQFIKAVKLEPNNTNLKNQIVAFLTASGNTERIPELQ